MDVRLEPVEGAWPPADTFVSVRVNDRQKQSRFAAAKSWHFPPSGGHEAATARIEVFRRLGTSTLSIDRHAGGKIHREVTIPCRDTALPSINLQLVAKLSSGPTDEVEQHKDASAQYLKDHKVEELVTDALKRTIKDKPEEPLQRLSSYLLQSMPSLPAAGSPLKRQRGNSAGGSKAAGRTQTQLEVQVDTPEGGYPADDIYLSVRLGDVQKQARFASMRSWRFPVASHGDNLDVRIDVYRRLGAMTEDLGVAAEQGSQEIGVPCSDLHMPELKMRLSVSGQVLDLSRSSPSLKLNKSKEMAWQYTKDLTNQEVLSGAIKKIVKEKPDNPHTALANYFGSRPLLPRLSEKDLNAPISGHPVYARSTSSSSSSGKRRSFLADAEDASKKKESLPLFGLEEHENIEATHLKPSAPLDKRATGDLADATLLHEEAEELPAVGLSDVATKEQHKTTHAEEDEAVKQQAKATAEALRAELAAVQAAHDMELNRLQQDAAASMDKLHGQLEALQAEVEDANAARDRCGAEAQARQDEALRAALADAQVAHDVDICRLQQEEAASMERLRGQVEALHAEMADASAARERWRSENKLHRDEELLPRFGTEQCKEEEEASPSKSYAELADAAIQASEAKSAEVETLQRELRDLKDRLSASEAVKEALKADREQAMQASRTRLAGVEDRQQELNELKEASKQAAQDLQAERQSRARLAAELQRLRESLEAAEEKLNEEHYREQAAMLISRICEQSKARHLQAFQSGPDTSPRSSCSIDGIEALQAEVADANAALDKWRVEAQAHQDEALQTALADAHAAHDVEIRRLHQEEAASMERLCGQVEALQAEIAEANAARDRWQVEAQTLAKDRLHAEDQMQQDEEVLPRFGFEEPQKEEATQLKPLPPLEERATGDFANTELMNEELPTTGQWGAATNVPLEATLAVEKEEALLSKETARMEEVSQAKELTGQLEAIKKERTDLADKLEQEAEKRKMDVMTLQQEYDAQLTSLRHSLQIAVLGQAVGVAKQRAWLEHCRRDWNEERKTHQERLAASSGAIEAERHRLTLAQEELRHHLTAEHARAEKRLQEKVLTLENQEAAAQRKLREELAAQDLDAAAPPTTSGARSFQSNPAAWLWPAPKKSPKPAGHGSAEEAKQQADEDKRTGVKIAPEALQELQPKGRYTDHDAASEPELEELRHKLKNMQDEMSAAQLAKEALAAERETAAFQKEEAIQASQAKSDEVEALQQELRDLKDRLSASEAVSEAVKEALTADRDEAIQASRAKSAAVDGMQQDLNDVKEASKQAAQDLEAERRKATRLMEEVQGLRASLQAAEDKLSEEHAILAESCQEQAATLISRICEESEASPRSIDGIEAQLAENQPPEPELASLQAERGEVEARPTELADQSKLGSLQALNEAKARVAELEEEVSQLKSAQADLQEAASAELASRQSRLELLQVERDDAKAQLQVALADKAAAAGTADEATAADLADHRSQLKSLQAECDEAKARSAELENQLWELRSMQAEHTEARLVGPNDQQLQVESLQVELNAAKASFAELDTNHQSLQAELEEAKASFAELDTNHQSLQAELEEAKAKSTELEKEVARLRSLQAEFNEARTKAMSAELDTNELEEAKEDVTQLRSLQAEIKEAIEKAEAASLDDQQSQLGPLQTELAEAKARSAELETNHQRQLGSLHSELEEAKAKSTELEKEVTQLRSLQEINEAKAKAEAASLDDQQSQLGSLQTEIAEAKARSAELETNHQRQLGSLHSELEEAKAKSTELEKEVTQLRSLQEINEANAKEDAAGLEDQQSQLASLQTELAEAKARSAEVDTNHQRQLGSLQAELDEAKDSSKQAALELDAERQGRLRLTDEVEALRRRLRAAEENRIEDAEERRASQGSYREEVALLISRICEQSEGAPSQSGSETSPWSSRSIVCTEERLGELDNLSELGPLQAKPAEPDDHMAQLVAVQGELVQAKARSAELENQLSQLGSIQVELTEAKARSAELENQVSQLRTLQAQISEATSAAQEGGEQLQLGPLRAELHDAKARSAELEKQVSQLSGLQAELVEAKARLEAAREHQATVVGSCPEEESKVDNDPSQLHAELQEAKARAAELESTQLQLSSLQAELDEAKAKLQAAQEASAETERSADEARSADVEKDQPQIGLLQAELEEAKAKAAELESTKSQLSSLQAELNEAKAKMQAGQQPSAETERGANEARAAELESTKSQLSSLQAELDEAKAKLQAAQESSSEAERSADEARIAELESTKSQLSSLQAELNEAKAKLQAAQEPSTENESSVNEVDKDQPQTKLLQAELEEAKARSTELENQLSQLGSLQAELDEAKAQLQVAHEQQVPADSTPDEAQQATEASPTKGKEEPEGSEQELKDLKEALEAERQSTARLLEEVRGLRESLRAAEEKLEEGSYSQSGSETSARSSRTDRTDRTEDFFTKYDVDGDGMLNISQLEALLSDPRYLASHGEILAYMQELYDRSPSPRSSGRIQQGFSRLARTATSHTESSIASEDLFTKHDEDGDGKLDAQQMQALLQEPQFAQRHPEMMKFMAGLGDETSPTGAAGSQDATNVPLEGAMSTGINDKNDEQAAAILADGNGMMGSHTGDLKTIAEEKELEVPSEAPPEEAIVHGVPPVTPIKAALKTAHASKRRQRRRSVRVTFASLETESTNQQAVGQTALRVAAMRDDAKLASRLLDRKANPNQNEGEGRTPLFYAAQAGASEVTQLLIARGADVHRRADADASSTHWRKDDALTTAACYGHVQVCTTLLEAGGRDDINSFSEYRQGSTWLRCSPLLAAAIAGHGSVARLLLDLHADPDLQQEDGSTALHLAVRVDEGAGHSDVIAVLLGAAGGGSGASGAQVDGMDARGWTPLSHAIAMGNIYCIRQLIQAGASVDKAISATQSHRDLIQAAGEKDLGLVVALLEDKADPSESKASSEWTEDGSEIEWTPLSVVARQPSQSLRMLELLLESAADVNKEVRAPPGYTAMHFAAAAGQLWAVEALHRAGCSNSLLGMGSDEQVCPSPAILAQQHGFEEVRKYLEAVEGTGAEPGHSRDRRDEAEQSVVNNPKEQERSKPSEVLTLQRTNTLSDTTPLRAAISRNDGTEVKRLLESKMNPNENEGEGRTPLFFASQSGAVDALVALIQGGADVRRRADRDADAMAWRNDDALTAASQQGSVDACLALLNAGASKDIDAMCEYKQGDAWFQCSPLLSAAMAGNGAVTRLLLDHGANPSVCQEDGSTPLHCAVRLQKDESHMEVIKELVSSTTSGDNERRHVQIDMKDTYGWTPLMHAVHNRNSPCIRLLVKSGASLEPDLLDSVAVDNLVEAVIQDHFGVVIAMLEAGWDPNKPKVEQDAVDHLKDGMVSFTPLCAAIRYERASSIPELLRARADPDQASIIYKAKGKGKNIHITPLSLAAQQRRVDFVQLLLDARADPNKNVEEGKVSIIFHSTPLSWAAQLGSVEIVHMLLEHAADINQDVQPPQGYTAMHFAAAAGQLEVVKELHHAGCGAALLGPDPGGGHPMKPAGLAAKKGFLEVAQYLDGAEPMPCDAKNDPQGLSIHK